VQLGNVQAYADELPLASRYCTDELIVIVYGELLWPLGPNPFGSNSSHVVSNGKDETYTGEGVNADLRTYLSYLGRLKRR
jgi:hypothetical protein